MNLIYSNVTLRERGLTYPKLAPKDNELELSLRRNQHYFSILDPSMSSADF